MAALLRCVVRAMLSPLIIKTQSSKNEDFQSKTQFYVKSKIFFSHLPTITTRSSCIFFCTIITQSLFTTLAIESLLIYCLFSLPLLYHCHCYRKWAHTIEHEPRITKISHKVAWKKTFTKHGCIPIQPLQLQ